MVAGMPGFGTPKKIYINAFLLLLKFPMSFNLEKNIFCCTVIE